MSACDRFTGCLKSVFVSPVVYCCKKTAEAGSALCEYTSEKVSSCRDSLLLCGAQCLLSCEETFDSCTEGLKSCGSSIVEATKSGCTSLAKGIKWAVVEADKSIGFVHSMCKAKENWQQGDYRGLTRETLASLKFIPRVIQGYVFINSDFEGEKVVPALLTTTLCGCVIETIDLVEVCMFSSQMSDDSVVPEEFAAQLADTRPAYFRRIFSENVSGQELTNLSKPGDFIQEAFSIMKYKKAMHATSAIVRVSAGFIFIESGDHDMDKMNKKEFLFGVWVISNGITWGLSKLLRGRSTKALEETVKQNQTPRVFQRLSSVALSTCASTTSLATLVIVDPSTASTGSLTPSDHSASPLEICNMEPSSPVDLSPTQVPGSIIPAAPFRSPSDSSGSGDSLYSIEEGGVVPVRLSGRPSTLGLEVPAHRVAGLTELVISSFPEQAPQETGLEIVECINE